MFPFKEKLIMLAQENKRKAIGEKSQNKKIDPYQAMQADAQRRALSHQPVNEITTSNINEEAALCGKKDNSKKA